MATACAAQAAAARTSGLPEDRAAREKGGEASLASPTRPRPRAASNAARAVLLAKCLDQRGLGRRRPLRGQGREEPGPEGRVVAGAAVQEQARGGHERRAGRG